MKLLVSLASLGLLATPMATAESLDVTVDLPRLQIAEYHKPYVAIWVSKPDHSVAANLAVLYQQEDGPEGEGETWLKDMRQWWRRTGRNLDMPVDGISSPTRGPGQHAFEFNDASGPLAALPAGDYILNIEAAREVGGREHLRVPFQWGQGAFDASVTGETELGNVTLIVKD